MPGRKAIVALVALLGVALCLVAMLEAGHRIYDTIGPSRAVATADGGLHVLSQGAIHVFGPDGKRRKVIDLAKLGLTRIPSDIAVHRDGRIVVANADDTNLMRCSPDTGACERVEARLTPTLAIGRLNTAKLFIDEERARYFVSDNAGHRLLEMDFSGHRIAATARGTVLRPNQLALESPGRLRVADTDHHRIAVFEVDGDRIGRVVEEISANVELARPGRVWPFSSARMPNGETWALVAETGMKNADLIVFDSRGEPVKRIDLGGDSDPFDLEIWRDRVIVCDATRYRVDAFTFGGEKATALDDPAFAAELEDGQQSVDTWRYVRGFARVGLVLFPLLAIVVLHRFGDSLSFTTRPAIVPASTTDTGSSDIRWIEVAPAYFDGARRRFLVFVLFMVAVYGGVFFVLYRLFGWDVILANRSLRFRLGEMGVILLILLALVPLARWIAQRFMGSYRLGASRDGFHYTSAPLVGLSRFSRSGEVPWDEVYFDGTRLLAGRRMLAVKGLTGAQLFSPQELREVLLANVPRENFVTMANLLKHAYGRWILWVLGLLFVALAIDLGHIAWLLSKPPL